MRIINRILIIVLALAATGCIDRPMTLFERLQDARQLTAEALVQFTKAADASNRALIATTDDSAGSAARDAEQTLVLVQTEIDKLKSMLVDLEYPNESQLLDEFTKRFAEYRQLDRQILEMAVESTNVKAQRLSFGPAPQQADAIQDALSSVAPHAGNKPRAEALIATVMRCVREIQALEAPHIAEASDESMAGIEKRMSAAESTARRSLAELNAIAPATAQSGLQAAAAALDQFMRLNSEIVALSRRNSNVRALALSLGQKRTLIAACEESLRALQAALAKRGFTGTK